MLTCTTCWYWDTKHKSCGNIICPNFGAQVKNPDEFSCAWVEPDYIKEGRENAKNQS